MKICNVFKLLCLFLPLKSLAHGQSSNPYYIRTETVSKAVYGVKSYEYGTGEVCGAIYNEMKSAACPPISSQNKSCGIERAILGREASCGVELYNSGTSTACGTNRVEFWSNWGEDCPANYEFFHGTTLSVIAGLPEFRVTRDGWKVYTQSRYPC